MEDSDAIWLLVKYFLKTVVCGFHIEQRLEASKIVLGFCLQDLMVTPVGVVHKPLGLVYYCVGYLLVRLLEYNSVVLTYLVDRYPALLIVVLVKLFLLEYALICVSTVEIVDD